MYDVIIIGAGPAGCAAAVYSARKKLNTLLITKDFGGQSVVSGDIQNWIGEKHISGAALAEKLEAQVRAFPEIAVKIGVRAETIKRIHCSEARICDFAVSSEKNQTDEAKSLILAMGARRRRLGIPGENELEGRGVVFCSTCDAPLFLGKKVAVIGGGNAGLEAVIDLLPYASDIYLLNRDAFPKGDPVTLAEIKTHKKVEIILNVSPLKILGEKFVSGLEYQDRELNQIKTMELEGVFVEIGSVPNSEMVKDLVAIDQWGQVEINCRYATTSHEGIFAAGDVTNDPFKQNNISAGDGVRAALSAYAYLQKLTKKSPAEEI